MTLPWPVLPPIDDPDFQQALQETIDALGLNQTAAPTTWAGVAYANSWQDAAGFGAGKYRKLPDRTVQLSGVIDRNGNNWVPGQALFTLPAGFRPTARVMLEVGVEDAAGAYSLGRIDVQTDGQVKLVYGGATNPVGYMILDGKSFYGGA